MKLLQIHRKRSKGATMVEYALVIILIAILAIAALRYLGTRVSGQYVDISGQITL